MPQPTDQTVDSDESAERLAASLDHLESNIDNIARLKPLAAATSSYGDRLGIWINGESKRLRLCCNQILLERIEQDGKARIRMNPSPCNMRVACPICGDYWTVRNCKRIKSDTLSVLELHPDALIYFVTIVPPKPDRELLPPLEKVIEVLKWLSDQCRSAKKKRKHRGTKPKTQMAKVLGGVEYIEFPKVRAKNRKSMLWFPHAHGIWATSSPIDVDALRAEIREKFGPGYQIDLKRPDEDVAFLKRLGKAANEPFTLTQRQAAQRRDSIDAALARLAFYFTKELDADELLVEPEPGEEDDIPEIDFAEAKRRLMAYNSLRPVEEYEDPATGEVRKRRARSPAIVKTFGCFWGLKAQLALATAPNATFPVVKIRPDGTRIGFKAKHSEPVSKPVVTERIELRYRRGKGFQEPA
ncbi:MAG: hypothetical protein DPW14_04560 [Planctomycetes bacterium]|nr:hypothetical protein [Planctomycetota bacterium]